MIKQSERELAVLEREMKRELRRDVYKELLKLVQRGTLQYKSEKNKTKKISPTESQEEKAWTGGAEDGKLPDASTHDLPKSWRFLHVWISIEIYSCEGLFDTGSHSAVCWMLDEMKEARGRVLVKLKQDVELKTWSLPSCQQWRVAL